jgi:hypothetical protein
MIRKVLILALALSGIYGCASIDFYEVGKDGTMTEKGFLYYPPKPYLLVEMKDNDIVTKMITLPDTTRPHRVKQGSGWGTSDLSFAIENGMIKSFNSKMDSKSPETIAALAGLGTAKAAMDTAEAAIVTATKSKPTDGKMKIMVKNDEEEIYEVNYKVKAFEECSNFLENEVIPPLQKRKKSFKVEINILKCVSDTIKDNVAIDYDPLKPDGLLLNVEKRRNLAKKLITRLENVSNTLSFYADNKTKKPGLITPAQESRTALKKVIKKLAAFSLRSSSITGLYEIHYIDGHLNLYKVTYDLP